MSLLTVDSLSIEYDDKPAVVGLSFALDAGESVGLVGESGSGKTQTALALLGLLPANATTSGSIVLDGTEIVGANERTLDSLRATRIAMIFQDPALALNPYVRIGRQLRRILLSHQLADESGADARVLEMLDAVGLPDARRQARAYPHQLSGGMRQRAMIASALLAKPDLLIADEPTTALDVTVQAQILDLLGDIRENTALLLITHDLGVVAGNCERTLVLERGKLVEAGSTASLFASPDSEHMRTLLAAAPRLDRDDAPEPVEGETIFSGEDLCVSYRAPGEQRLHAVRDVDFTVRAGETVAIVGESGSGKSSLVRAALGLVEADAGAVLFLGEPLERAARQRASSTRRDLQLVFQDPVGSLNPQWRVRDIIAEPILVHEPTLTLVERLERVTDILDRVGLGDEYLDRHPHELSGGQAQRVAIARALILRPRVLVCDEAVSALDGTVREQILDMLRAEQERSGLSIVFISHDLGVVRAVSHRVLVLYLGRLVEVADNDALFGSPKHPYTKALLEAVPAPDPFAMRPETLLEGEVPSLYSPPSGCAFHPRCRFADERCDRQTPELRRVAESDVACIRADEIASKPQ